MKLRIICPISWILYIWVFWKKPKRHTTENAMLTASQKTRIMRSKIQKRKEPNKIWRMRVSNKIKIKLLQLTNNIPRVRAETGINFQMMRILMNKTQNHKNEGDGQIQNQTIATDQQKRIIFFLNTHLFKFFMLNSKKKMKHWFSYFLVLMGAWVKNQRISMPVVLYLSVIIFLPEVS